MKFVCCIAAALACSLPAYAQEPLWEVGVLGGAASTPAYPGAQVQTRRGLLLPYLIYRGKVMRVDRSGIGARLVNTERYEFDVGLAASLPARSDDVEARAGMSDLGTLLELGPRLKVRLARLSPSSSVRLDLPLRAVIEARSGLRTQGFTFEPKLVYESDGPKEAWTFDANLGMVIGDRKINRYFYEVQPQFATAGRPAYAADAGLVLVRTGLTGSRLLHRDLRVFGFVRYESYAGAANRASPLHKRDSGVSAGVGFAWTIMQSSQPAR